MRSGYDTPDECLYPTFEEALELEGIDPTDVDPDNYYGWSWSDIVSALISQQDPERSEREEQAARRRKFEAYKRFKAHKNALRR